MALRVSFSCAKSARELCQDFSSLSFQLLEEPGLGVSPEPVRAAPRQAEQLRRIAHGLAGEIAKMDEFSRLWLNRCQPGQRLVQRQQVIRALRRSNREILQIKSLAS